MKKNTVRRHEIQKAGKINAWKRYGILMAGLVMAGSVLGSSTMGLMASAEGVAFNIAEDAKTETSEETETEAAEETEKETFAQIEKVQTGDSLVSAIDVSGVVEACMPSIVSITNTAIEQVQSIYGIQEYEAEGAASGIIIAQTDTELLIATNSHVVKDRDENYVWFSVDVEEEEDAKVPAKVKGMDQTSELAVVAVELSDIPEDVLSKLKIAELGSSSALKVGETSISIGNELGYGQSVTCGIISALDRELIMDDFSGKMILMDTTINFGSSGGAVLNSKGQVVGICVAKEAGTGSEGMAYAIPIDYAIPVLQRLAERETRDKLTSSTRGYMGATVVNVSDDAIDLYNMPRGAFVYEVSEGSAAEKAGIKKGDVVTKFDGETVLGSDDLIEKMSFYNVGETVTVEVMTANGGEYEAREVEVTLQEGGSDAEDAEEEAAETEDMDNAEDSDTEDDKEDNMISDLLPGMDEYMEDQNGSPYGFGGFDFPFPEGFGRFF